jgi:hypothetical protein
MKPRIKSYPSKSTSRKWCCVSEEGGEYGPYERIGTGYSIQEAYAKWLRHGRHGGWSWRWCRGVRAK